jgi:hypothetical protein
MSEHLGDRLWKLLRQRRVVALSELFEALGTRSRMTVFRRLREVDYRTSFTHRGQYDTLAGLPEFDQWGLWFHGDIGFSRSGTLKETAAVQVEQAPDGRTHGELSHLLRVRVHNPLLELVHEGRIGRERYRGQQLYVSADADRAAEQVRQRLAGDRVVARIGREPTIEESIEILGQALRGAAEIPSPLEVVRGLAARGVSVEADHVHCVYEAHGLAPGKKTAPPT